eukprot:GHVR01009927.1.p1 GENE.GHVR01009927.1~~GHVR01009927.1.p1  ORF type:complete len:431 (-),score=44.61 GHVR01009927.1:1397-2689(-)
MCCFCITHIYIYICMYMYIADKNHWNERVFDNEIMSAHPVGNRYLSSVTLAFMKDLGWYKPVPWMAYNPITSSSIALKESSCAWLEGPCISIVDGKSRKLSRSPVCVAQSEGCTFDLRSRATCTMFRREKNKIPKSMQYFKIAQLGGTPSREYCPFFQPKQGGLPCNQIPQKKADQSDGQTYGNNSKCFTLMRKKGKNGKKKKNVAKAVCYNVTCEPDGNLNDPYRVWKSATIQLQDKNIVCNNEDQGKYKKRADKSAIKCPNLDVLCYNYPCVDGSWTKAGCVCAAGVYGSLCNRRIGSKNWSLIPRNFFYDVSEGTLVVGKRYVFYPKTHGGKIIRYYVVYRLLPEGLTLDQDTGVVIGVPIKVSECKDYFIIGTGDRETTQTAIRLQVITEEMKEKLVEKNSTPYDDCNYLIQPNSLNLNWRSTTTY